MHSPNTLNKFQFLVPAGGSEHPRGSKKFALIGPRSTSWTSELGKDSKAASSEIKKDWLESLTTACGSSGTRLSMELPGPGSCWQANYRRYSVPDLGEA